MDEIFHINVCVCILKIPDNDDDVPWIIELVLYILFHLILKGLNLSFMLRSSVTVPSVYPTDVTSHVKLTKALFTG